MSRPTDAFDFEIGIPVDAPVMAIERAVAPESDPGPPGWRTELNRPLIGWKPGAAAIASVPRVGYGVP